MDGGENAAGAGGRRGGVLWSYEGDEAWQAAFAALLFVWSSHLYHYIIDTIEKYVCVRLWVLGLCLGED